MHILLVCLSPAFVKKGCLRTWLLCDSLSLTCNLMSCICYEQDFMEMIVHHFATLGLMFFSWMNNFVRVGSLVLLIHDCADPIMEVSRDINCYNANYLLVKQILRWSLNKYTWSLMETHFHTYTTKQMWKRD